MPPDDAVMEGIPIRKQNILKAVSSPWMIIVFLLIGWGPLLVCDMVRLAHPDFDAIHFATEWIGMALVCSFLAVIFAVVHAIRFVIRMMGSNDGGGLNL